MSWFLYVLECRDNSLYTGIAIDVEKRFALHVAGKGAKYTRSHQPRRILAIKAYPDRSAASKAEHEIKKMSAAEKRKFCAQHMPVAVTALPLDEEASRHE